MATAKKRGLGRGLDALLGSLDGDADSAPAAASPEILQHLPVGAIQPGKYQPRQAMDPEKLEELAASIRAQGVIEPVVVRAVGAGRYELIAGERRWRATQLAGLAEIPALVREVDDRAVVAIALIENIQREELTPLEESQALKRLIDEFDLTHAQVAEAVGRSRAAVSNLLRLMELPAEIKALLEARKLDMGHARALLPLPGATQVGLANVIAAKGLSVREAERLAYQALHPKPQSAAPAPDRDILRLEEEVADRLGATVKIKANKKGAGMVTIHFGTLDQLDGLLERLR